MSSIDDDNPNPIITNLFANPNITGFELAKHADLADLVKRDSTDFACQVIKHKRGQQIICELIDVALRPKTLIAYLEKQKQTKNTSNLSAFIEQCPKFLLTQNNTQITPQVTTIIYNAVQILTNQYEDFVKFIFQKKGSLSLSQQFVPSSQKDQSSKKKQSNQQGKPEQKIPFIEDEDCDDCVIMDGNMPELSKNEEDNLLKKISNLAKISDLDPFQCEVLERMFKLFEQPSPIEETPVSYFNKIILQFVYQKPQEIMRFFYCQDSFISKKNEVNCPKIRTIAFHLYNHSVIELLTHLMQLQNDGNFYPQQKIQILKAITEQVFRFKEEPIKNAFSFDEETSTMSDMTQERVCNYILFIKALYEKLEDRYEQEKFLQIFKYHLNDEKLLQKVISFFMHHFNFFDTSGLSTLLIQILKLDQTNFRLHKASNQATSPFGGNKDFSFSAKNQQSSIASYDLKLSKQILDQIEKVLTILSKKYEQWEGSTMRMIEYYELIHCWLNVTIKDRQTYTKKHLITPNFINQCLFKIQSHERSTILHNSIKNIICDFLPKLNDSITIILSPQCQVLQFIQNYLDNYTQNSCKPKRKCFQNQLYHIGKTLLSVWQQHKMLKVIKKTQDDEQDLLEKVPTQEPYSPTTDGQNIIRIQKLRTIITKKQEFYDHLICGDPRKMGEYQEQQSSEIIMASSFKNFFKPSLGNVIPEINNHETKQLNRDRYGSEDKQQDDQRSSKNKRQVEDLKKQTNLKTDQRFRNLKIGDDHSNLLFESAISPLNANRSHTFNFDFDALPLDSDNSGEVVSEQEDLPARQGSGANQDEIKLMQENIQNFQMISGNVLGVQSNILSSNHSISNDRNFLSGDKHRRDQLSKSMDYPQLNMDNIQRVDSYIAMDSSRKQSQDDILSLGLDSNKQSGSKISDQNFLTSKIDQIISEKPASFIKQDSRNNVLQEEQNQQLNDNKEIQTIDSNFVKHYSSYLKFDLNELCNEIQ